jgi:uncharacterized protein (TIGR03382 family)
MQVEARAEGRRHLQQQILFSVTLKPAAEVAPAAGGCQSAPAGQLAPVAGLAVALLLRRRSRLSRSRTI